MAIKRRNFKNVNLEVLYVIQWNARERVMMVCPFATMIEKNVPAYFANRDSGFYPIAFACDRDHAEEVAGKIMDARERRSSEKTLTVETVGCNREWGL